MRGLGSLIAMVHIFDNPYRLGRRGHSTHPAVVLNLTHRERTTPNYEFKRQAPPPPDGHPLIKDDLKFRDVI